MSTSIATLEVDMPTVKAPGIWKGLLLREWWGHRPLLLWIGTLYALSPAIALYLLYVGMLHGRYASWTWTYWVGVVLAVVLGLALGGAETTAGLEEGSLSLPATRAQRFWARFGFAWGVLLLHALVNTAALFVWDAVLLRPDLAAGGWTAWWISALLLPCLFFSLMWTSAVNGGPGRRIIFYLAALAISYLALVFSGIALPANWGHQRMFQIQNSYWALGATLWMLFLSYRIYLTREIHAVRDD